MMTMAIGADRKGISADRDGDPRRSQGPSPARWSSPLIAMVIDNDRHGDHTDRNGDDRWSPMRSLPIAMATRTYRHARTRQRYRHRGWSHGWSAESTMAIGDKGMGDRCRSHWCMRRSPMRSAGDAAVIVDDRQGDGLRRPRSWSFKPLDSLAF
jgi:hypothetical protein